ncbi:MAG: M23 family metallopeptidase [Oscillospiraceae bacterium]
MNNNLLNALDMLDEKFIDEALRSQRLESNAPVYLRNAAIGLGTAAAVAAVGVGVARLNADKGVSISMSSQAQSASSALSELLAASSGASETTASTAEPSQVFNAPMQVELIPMDTAAMSKVYLGSAEPYMVAADSEKAVFCAGGDGLFVMYYAACIDSAQPLGTDKPFGMTVAANVGASIEAVFAAEEYGYTADSIRFVGREDGSVWCVVSVSSGGSDFSLAYLVNFEENRLDYIGTIDEIPEIYNSRPIDTSVIASAFSPNGIWISDTDYIYLSHETGGYVPLYREDYDRIGFTPSQLKDICINVRYEYNKASSCRIVAFSQELTYDAYMRYRLENGIHETAEQAEYEKAWFEGVDCSEFALPLDEKYVSSTDCYRTITVAGTDELEKIFVPLVAEPDAPVYASQDGTVIFSDFLPLSARGQMIVIEHDNGLLTVYWGVSNLEDNRVVSVGDRVSKGDIIGCCDVFGYMDDWGVYVQVCTPEEAAEILPNEMTGIDDRTLKYTDVIDTSDYAIPLEERDSADYCDIWRRKVESGEASAYFNLCHAYRGTEVYAAQDGEVVFAGNCGTYMNLVRIRHADGIETWYCVLDEILVNVGDTVTKGQQIGTVGHLPTGAYGIGVGAFTAEEAEAKLAQFAY